MAGSGALDVFIYQLFIQVPSEWAPIVGILIEIIYTCIYIYVVFLEISGGLLFPEGHGIPKI